MGNEGDNKPKIFTKSIYIKKESARKYYELILQHLPVYDPASVLSVHHREGCTIASIHDCYEGSWQEYLVHIRTDKEGNLEKLMQKFKDNKIDFKGEY